MEISRILLLVILAAVVAWSLGCSRVQGQTTMVAQADKGKDAAADKDKDVAADKDKSPVAEKKGKAPAAEKESKENKECKVYDPAPLGFLRCCDLQAFPEFKAPPEEVRQKAEQWQYAPIVDIQGNPFSPFDVPEPPSVQPGPLGAGQMLDPYDLNQMKLVGVIMGAFMGSNRAYIIFPDGRKRTVGVGDNLGKQGGVVTEIGMKETGRTVGLGNMIAKERVGYIIVTEEKMDPANPSNQFILQRELDARGGDLFK